MFPKCSHFSKSLSLCVHMLVPLPGPHPSLPSITEKHLFPFKTAKMSFAQEDWGWGPFSTGDRGWGQWQAPAGQHMEIPFRAEILIPCSLPPWREFLQGRPILIYGRLTSATAALGVIAFIWLLLDGSSAIAAVGPGLPLFFSRT